MKTIIILGVLLATAINAAGQKQNIDSLISVLNAGTLPVERQLQLYEDIAHYYYAAYDSDNSRAYAVKGLALSEKVKDDLKTSTFNEYIGYAYKSEMNRDTAFIYFERALDYALKANDAEQLVSVYLDFGAWYGDKEMWDVACEYFLKALPLSETLENKTKYIALLGNIGSAHRMLSNPEKAMHYFEQMREEAEKAGNLLHKRKAYYELGILHKDKKEYAKAIEYLQTALDISRSTDNKIYQAVCLQTLAQLYTHEEVKDYDKALGYALESLPLVEGIKNPLYAAGSWTTLSIVYCRQGKFKESIAAAYQSIERDTTNMYHLIALYTNMTDSYLGLANSDSAAYFFHKYRDLKDRYITKELQESMAEMETLYETNKKEMQIASLEKERKMYVWLGISGVLLAMALVFVLWQTRRSARKEKLLIATRSVLDGEMRERTRLAQDLHDRLSGNLSAVKIELTNQTESLQALGNKIDNCIKDIRNTAHDLMPPSLQFGMKASLRDFAAQFPNVRFHYFGEEGRIDPRTEFVIYCCANELVNNSIKHSGAQHIDLQLVQNEKYVVLTVSDDGCGFDEKSVKKGIGLKSVCDRVASCNGKMDIVTSPGRGAEMTVEVEVGN